MQFSVTPEGVLSGGDFNKLYTQADGDDESFRYFRDISRSFATFFAHVECDARLAAYPDAELFHFLDSAPPIRGREYITESFLRSLLSGFVDYLVLESESRSILACEVIRSSSPEWRDVGRVAFHLAENRNSETRHFKPFVFLATFVVRLGADSAPKHVPLGSALKRFADDRQTLGSIMRSLERASSGSAFLRSLFDTKSLFRPCEWTAAEAYNFVHDSELFREAGIAVRYSNLWKSGKVSRLKANVMLDIGKRRGGFGSDSLIRFNVSAAAGEGVLTESELAEILKMPPSLIRIKGEWVDADTEKVAYLLNRWNAARDYAEFAGLTFMQSLRILARAGIREDAMPTAPLDDELVSVTLSDSFGGLLKSLLSASADDIPESPEGVACVLRSYQRAGVSFMYRASQLGCGVCLADDMGLGKTLQTICFISLLLSRDPASRVLIVVPASLLLNWRNEFARFAPSVCVGILHSSARGTENYCDPSSRVVLTTYSMLTRGREELESEFTAIVLDEAQNIKNPSSRQSLAARRLKGRVRIALTGTPIENSLTDLWSIFDFINPGLLGSMSSFREYVRSLEERGKSGGRTDYSPLVRLVKPFILRRMKSDPLIAPELPAKCELKAFCRLTPFQIRLYSKLVDDLKRNLETATERERSTLVLSSLIQFKQLCNHPSQFTGNTEYLPERSGKFLRLIEIASEIASRGEKVLVFTQFRELTEPLADCLSGIFGRGGLILHGGVPVPKRMELVRDFQRPAGPPFFVITVKAGGTGLNLTAAAHVIHFDRWWNPAAEDQATDRAHRIGQTRKVIVHKLITEGTLEEKIDVLISGKKYLSESILSGREPVKLIVDMSDSELLDLVKLRDDAV